MGAPECRILLSQGVAGLALRQRSEARLRFGTNGSKNLLTFANQIQNSIPALDEHVSKKTYGTEILELFDFEAHIPDNHV